MPRFVLHTFLLRLPSIQNARCPVIVTGGMRLTTKSNEVDGRCSKDVPSTYCLLLFKNDDTYNSLKSIIPSWFKSNVWNCNLKSTMSASLNSGNSNINDRKSFSPISKTKRSETHFTCYIVSSLHGLFCLIIKAWLSRPPICDVVAGCNWQRSAISSTGSRAHLRGIADVL